MATWPNIPSSSPDDPDSVEYMIQQAQDAWDVQPDPEPRPAMTPEDMVNFIKNSGVVPSSGRTTGIIPLGDAPGLDVSPSKGATPGTSQAGVQKEPAQAKATSDITNPASPEQVSQKLAEQGVRPTPKQVQTSVPRKEVEGPKKAGCGVKPQAQRNSVSCGQTAVAQVASALTGKDITDADVNNMFGFGLHTALNSLTGATGVQWSDQDFAGKSTWKKIETGIKKGIPSIIGLGGPKFAASTTGHIVTITDIVGDRVQIADPNGGRVRWTTKQVIEQDPGHSQGKFVFTGQGDLKGGAQYDFGEAILPAQDGSPRALLENKAMSMRDQYYNINDPNNYMLNMWGTESNWKPDAVNPSSGAGGLVQMMPATFEGVKQELGDKITWEEFMDSPGKQLQYGTYYMKQQLDKYGTWPMAMAAYNAGPGTLDAFLADSRAASLKYRRKLPSETLKYVMKNIPGVSTPEQAEALILSSDPKIETQAGFVNLKYLAAPKANKEFESQAMATGKSFTKQFLGSVAGLFEGLAPEELFGFDGGAVLQEYFNDPDFTAGEQQGARRGAQFASGYTQRMADIAEMILPKSVFTNPWREKADTLTPQDEVLYSLVYDTMADDQGNPSIVGDFLYAMQDSLMEGLGSTAGATHAFTRGAGWVATPAAKLISRVTAARTVERSAGLGAKTGAAFINNMRMEVVAAEHWARTQFNKYLRQYSEDPNMTPGEALLAASKVAAWEGVMAFAMGNAVRWGNVMTEGFKGAARGTASLASDVLDDLLLKTNTGELGVPKSDYNATAFESHVKHPLQELYAKGVKRLLPPDRIASLQKLATKAYNAADSAVTDELNRGVKELIHMYKSELEGREVFTRTRRVADMQKQRVTELDSELIKTEEIITELGTKKQAVDTEVQQIEQQHQQLLDSDPDMPQIEQIALELDKARAEWDQVSNELNQLNAEVEGGGSNYNAQLRKLHAQGKKEQATALRERREGLIRRQEYLKNHGKTLTETRSDLIKVSEAAAKDQQAQPGLGIESSNLTYVGKESRIKASRAKIAKAKAAQKKFAQKEGAQLEALQKTHKGIKAEHQKATLTEVYYRKVSEQTQSKLLRDGKLKNTDQHLEPEYEAFQAVADEVMKPTKLGVQEPTIKDAFNYAKAAAEEYWLQEFIQVATKRGGLNKPQINPARRAREMMKEDISPTQLHHAADALEKVHGADDPSVTGIRDAAKTLEDAMLKASNNIAAEQAAAKEALVSSEDMISANLRTYVDDIKKTIPGEKLNEQELNLYHQTRDAITELDDNSIVNDLVAGVKELNERIAERQQPDFYDKAQADTASKAKEPKPKNLIDEMQEILAAKEEARGTGLVAPKTRKTRSKKIMNRMREFVDGLDPTKVDAAQRLTDFVNMLKAEIDEKQKQPAIDHAADVKNVQAAQVAAKEQAIKAAYTMEESIKLGGTREASVRPPTPTDDSVIDSWIKGPLGNLSKRRTDAPIQYHIDGPEAQAARHRNLVMQELAELAGEEPDNILNPTQKRMEDTGLDIPASAAERDFDARMNEFSKAVEAGEDYKHTLGRYMQNLFSLQGDSSGKWNSFKSMLLGIDAHQQAGRSMAKDVAKLTDTQVTKAYKQYRDRHQRLDAETRGVPQTYDEFQAEVLDLVWEGNSTAIKRRMTDDPHIRTAIRPLMKLVDMMEGMKHMSGDQITGNFMDLYFPVVRSRMDKVNKRKNISPFVKRALNAIGNEKERAFKKPSEAMELVKKAEDALGEKTPGFLKKYRKGKKSAGDDEGSWYQFITSTPKEQKNWLISAHPDRYVDWSNAQFADKIAEVAQGLLLGSPLTSVKDLGQSLVSNTYMVDGKRFMLRVGRAVDVTAGDSSPVPLVATKKELQEAGLWTGKDSPDPIRSSIEGGSIKAYVKLETKAKNLGLDFPKGETVYLHPEFDTFLQRHMSQNNFMDLMANKLDEAGWSRSADTAIAFKNLMLTGRGFPLMGFAGPFRQQIYGKFAVHFGHDVASISTARKIGSDIRRNHRNMQYHMERSGFQINDWEKATYGIVNDFSRQIAGKQKEIFSLHKLSPRQEKRLIRENPDLHREYLEYKTELETPGTPLHKQQQKLEELRALKEAGQADDKLIAAMEATESFLHKFVDFDTFLMNRLLFQDFNDMAMGAWMMKMDQLRQGKLATHLNNGHAYDEAMHMLEQQASTHMNQLSGNMRQALKEPIKASIASMLLQTPNYLYTKLRDGGNVITRGAGHIDDLLVKMGLKEKSDLNVFKHLHPDVREDLAIDLSREQWNGMLNMGLTAMGLHYALNETTTKDGREIQDVNANLGPGSEWKFMFNGMEIDLPQYKAYKLTSELLTLPTLLRATGATDLWSGLAYEAAQEPAGYNGVVGQSRAMNAGAEAIGRVVDSFANQFSWMAKVAASPAIEGQTAEQALIENTGLLRDYAGTVATGFRATQRMVGADTTTEQRIPAQNLLQGAKNPGAYVSSRIDALSTNANSNEAYDFGTKAMNSLFGFVIRKYHGNMNGLPERTKKWIESDKRGPNNDLDAYVTGEVTKLKMERDSYEDLKRMPGVDKNVYDEKIARIDAKFDKLMNEGMEGKLKGYKYPPRLQKMTPKGAPTSAHIDEKAAKRYWQMLYEETGDGADHAVMEQLPKEQRYNMGEYIDGPRSIKSNRGRKS